MRVECFVSLSMVYHLSMLSEPNINPAPSETGLAPKTKGLNSFTLKIMAIIAMTCNHAAYIFYSHLPYAPRCVLLAVGGLTFPIMAFLLVEGYVHTSNLKNYALRLLAFALVAEVPFWLFLGHEGNVLFTLLGGLVILWIADHVEEPWLRAILILTITLITWVCDWGSVGPVLVLLFYMLRERPWGIALAMLLPIGIGLYSTLGYFVEALNQGSWRNLPFVLYYALGNTAAIPLLMAYNGARGPSLKWFFYVYYPAHIAVLGIIHLLVFGDMPRLMVG